jgi:hypothetical protein
LIEIKQEEEDEIQEWKFWSSPRERSGNV